MANPVVHFEIVHKDAARLNTFYTDVFGWQIDTNNPMSYGIVDTGEGIGGGIGPVPDDSYSGHVTFYVQVADPDAVLAEVERRGGTVVMPATEIPGGGVTIAQFKDPAGNLIGLTKA